MRALPRLSRALSSSSGSGCSVPKRAGSIRAAAGGGGEKDEIPSLFSGPQRLMLKTETLAAPPSSAASAAATAIAAAAAGLPQPSQSFSGGMDAWSAQQRTMTDRIFYSPIAVSEKNIRRDLSTAHRLMARYGYDDLVWNHISARCGATADSEEEDCCDIDPTSYLITPGGLHFSEVRPEDLVFDSIEESGNILHSGIYAKRPDVRAIIHAHTPASMAVGVLEEGFVHLVQDSAAFYNKIGYHDWEGLHTSEEEKDRVAKNLGKGDVLFLRNHGVVVVGKSIQEAFVKYYYLERCCRVQLDAMSTGRKVRPMPAEMMEHAASQLEKYFPHGKYEWRALSRLVEPKSN